MKHKRTALIFIIAILLQSALFAAVPSALETTINEASAAHLSALADAFSITVSGTESEMRQQILYYLDFRYFGDFDTALSFEFGKEAVSGEGSFTLNLEYADSLTNTGAVTVMQGQVSLAVSFQGGEEKRLYADKIIIDTNSKLLTAIGSVRFSDSDSSGRDFTGEVVCYNWESLDVVLSGGSAAQERTNNLGENVSFYATGKTISYLGSSEAVLFTEGSIATRQENPNWSIRASRIALLSGGDLFITNASLYLGRVPLLWLPAFFYPGTRLVINPAIGLDSAKGMFVNTSYELYGNYNFSQSSLNKDSSSFASFLSSGSSGAQVKGKVVYEQATGNEELSGLEKWADDTGSYALLMLDAYEEGGLFAGIDTSDKFFSDRLSVKAIAGLAVDLSFANETLRWFETLSGTAKFDRLSLKFSVPYYTDPNVMKYYANRLTDFTIDSVLGQTQIFPTTYTSVTKFDWSLSGSSDLTPKNSDIINSLKLSTIEALLSFKWDDSAQTYTVSGATLPHIKASIDGTLYDATKTVSLEDTPAEVIEEADYSPEEKVEESLDLSSLSFYTANENKDSKSSSSSKKRKYSISLGYKWNNDFSDVFEEPEDSGDFDISYKTDLSLTFKSQAADWLDLTQTVTPSYSLNATRNDFSDNAKGSSVLKLSVPKFGLTYNLGWKFFNMDEDGSLEAFVWDKTHITAHNIQLSSKLDAFTLSLSRVLAPLKQNLTAKVSYSDGPLSASVSQKFNEGEASRLEMSVANADVAFKEDNLNISVSSSYDMAKLSEGWDSFKFTQKARLEIAGGDAYLSDELRLVSSFKPQSLVLNAGYLKNTLKLSFEGEHLKKDKLSLYLQGEDLSLSFWKGRINFRLTGDLKFDYDFNNRYAASLSAEYGVHFGIAEFLELNVSAVTSNRGFYRYYDGTKFSFAALFDDLARSLDFFGDGRYNTNFTLSGLSIEGVHHMEDWDLHCKVSSSVVLSDGNWNWHETATFYIQWNTIPDLKTEYQRERDI